MKGEYQKSEEAFKSKNIYINLFGENHPEVANLLNWLGILYEDIENMKRQNFH